VLLLFNIHVPEALFMNVSMPISPQVKFTERRTSFFHFLTNVCAIVGGKLLPPQTWFQLGSQLLKDLQLVFVCLNLM
jgi:hypothetical protein